jgi:hypothetical protein
VLEQLNIICDLLDDAIGVRYVPKQDDEGNWRVEPDVGPRTTAFVLSVGDSYWGGRNERGADIWVSNVQSARLHQTAALAGISRNRCIWHHPRGPRPRSMRRPVGAEYGSPERRAFDQREGEISAWLQAIQISETVVPRSKLTAQPRLISRTGLPTGLEVSRG